MGDILKFINRRSGEKSRLTKIAGKVKGHANNALSFEEVNEVLLNLDKIEFNTQAIYNEICGIIMEEENLMVQIEATDAIYVQISELRVKVRGIMSSLEIAGPSQVSKTGPEFRHKVTEVKAKLPKLELPKFNGQYEDWLSFKDQFLSTIGNNLGLASCDKLQYLKTCLTGEPLNLISSFQNTNSNYRPAWDFLKDRYDNSREIIFALGQKLINLKKVNNENAGELRKLCDSFQQIIRELTNLGRKVSDWDDLLVILLTSKLDPETKREWAKSFKDTTMPSMQDLNTFLENHIRGLLALSSTSKPAQPENSRSIRKGSDKCTWTAKCKICQQSHNSLLHVDRKEAKPEPPPTNVNANFASGIRVLLGTAIVNVEDSCGDLQQRRVLLDSGSEATLITESCAARLGIKRRKCNVIVSGVGSGSSQRVMGQVEFNVKSRMTTFDIRVDALILSKVTGRLPSVHLGDRWKNWDHIHGLVLADPAFYNPSDIDILLGADVTELIFKDQRLRGKSGQPVARSSELGWVLIGASGINTNASGIESGATTFQVNNAHCETMDLLHRLWELDAVPVRPQWTEEEKQADEHFIKNHSRDESGKYVVPLPFSSKLLQLGGSRNIAYKRLLSIERRLVRYPDCRNQYIQFMKEYEQLGHMESVPENKCGEVIGKTNYLPHHFVLKEDSSTTKLRVVFDGSCPCTSGAILWRESPELPVKEYRLKTVTYGTACAPFSATRCFLQLANNEGYDLPVAAQAIRSNFYVDDHVNSLMTRSDAKVTYNELTTIASRAKLELRKWECNDVEICKMFNQTVASGAVTPLPHDPNSKALGVYWESNLDILKFADFSCTETVFTKRSILKQMSKIFDPLGLLSPFTVSAKILYQKVWAQEKESGVESWDKPIAHILTESWQQYMDDMKSLSKISLPRSLCGADGKMFDLHGFSDASEHAYSAVVYLRSRLANKHFDMRIIAAKTRVAPLKAQTLPRLELCGALHLAKLIKQVTEAVDLKLPIRCWSDSEIVLDWVAAPSRKWVTFVANRVAEIQEVLPDIKWNYVPSELNPADCASRGKSLDELLTFDLWWNGPKFLQHEEMRSFGRSLKIPIEQVEQRKIVLVVDHEFNDNVLSRYSSLNKMVRVMAYILRAVKIWKKSAADKPNPTLSVTELNEALNKCIWLSQLQDFSVELAQLKRRGTRVKSSNRLSKLSPFVDGEGMLRVGGRIGLALLSENSKHPMILCGKPKLTKLLVNDWHVRLLHCGELLLKTQLQSMYWIIRSRNCIKGILRNCYRCKRAKGRTASQLMGSLPAQRVRPAAVFENTGVDYAGPLRIQILSGRGRKEFKAYICLFVCFAIKAIHLEVVTDLATESFLAAFKRFVSRRGKPSHMFSDCGTNFQGAAKELAELVKCEAHNHAVSEALSLDGIQWHFNPPHAPHQGGLWESAVKSVKTHLIRIIGTDILSLQELETTLCQIEGVLNSRPLSELSCDPENLEALTPGHFLVGRSIKAVPELNVTTISDNRLSRWQRQQKIVQTFWKRWSSEYLTSTRKIEME